MTTYISLLRGINLGRARQVPMPRLQQIYTGLGLRDVTTYIRSGNVIFRSDAEPEHDRQRLEAALADELGIEVGVVIRTHEEMAGVVARNPFPGAEPPHLAVSFLSAPAPEDLSARIDPAQQDDDEYVVDGREVYLHLPHGFGRSKLASRMSTLRLPVVATTRNWRTVGKLVDMSA